MSLRLIVCTLAVIYFSIYAWKNWFVSLCANMVLMAFLEHPDMPKSILGIHGFNLWNLLMLNVLLSWWNERRAQARIWDMPRHINVMMLMYVFVIVWSYLRMLGDEGALQTLNAHHAGRSQESFSFTWITSEYVINCIKWMLPGMLFFDACRTRERVTLGLAFILTLYGLLAAQVIKHMPLNAVAMDSKELSRLAAHILDLSIGYFRTELSMMLAGASWAALSVLVLVKKRRNQLLLIALAGAISLAQAETGGRAGYVTWGLTGLVLCLLRWRKLLPLIPVTIFIVAVFCPGVRDRMLQGFAHKEGAIVTEQDDSVITSGRVIAWGYVIPKIEESPLIGWGRQAMIRTGIYERIMREHNEGETFPHPHNAYLELLLDNGLIGFLLVIPFYVVALTKSIRLLLDRSDPIFSAVGGVCAALLLGLLFASMGSQSFYPKESSMPMWCSIGIMLRVYMERKHAWETGEPLFGESQSEEIEEQFEESPAMDIPARA
jgi:O-antigen ligase